MDSSIFEQLNRINDDDDSIVEGLFDGGRKKKQMYEKAISDVFKKAPSGVGMDIANAITGLVGKFSGGDGASAERFNANFKAAAQSAYNEVKKKFTSTTLIKLANLGNQHGVNAENSNDAEALQNFAKKCNELKKVPKIGYKACDYLMEKIQPQVLSALDRAIKNIR